jgi:phage gp36-like protein
LPNDLSRLIFLATLRDNNSGHYYHPEVAQRFSAEVADQAMLACHRQIYEQVVGLALEDLTDQLDAYLATVRAPIERSIESWTKLRAYRATIPMDTDPISAEIFFMKVEVAVAILEARLPGRVQ